MAHVALGFCIFKGLAAPPTGGMKAKVNLAGLHLVASTAQSQKFELKTSQTHIVCSKENINPNYASKKDCFDVFSHSFVVTQALDRPHAAPSDKGKAAAAPYRHQAVTK